VLAPASRFSRFHRCSPLHDPRSSGSVFKPYINWWQSSVPAIGKPWLNKIRTWILQTFPCLLVGPTRVGCQTTAYGESHSHPHAYTSVEVIMTSKDWRPVRSHRHRHQACPCRRKRDLPGSTARLTKHLHRRNVQMLGQPRTARHGASRVISRTRCSSLGKLTSIILPPRAGVYELTQSGHC
jgi:hypothetical protein